MSELEYVDKLFERWWQGGVTGEYDPWLEMTDAENEAAVRRVGDLLEPGDYPTTRPAIQRRRSEKPAGPTMALMRTYRVSHPDAFDLCDISFIDGSSIGLCLLPRKHPRWDGECGVEDKTGNRHRVMRFSPRDSAAMLAGMRRRLTEPMEEL